MASGRSFKLSSGYSMPAVGLGTWQSKNDEVCQAVKTALEAGYRHIDAAAVYGNEKQVGDGIKASGVPRSEIFVSFRHSNETIQPVDAGTGLIDVIDVPIKDTWAAMERLVEQGKIRTIGVSNFTQAKIEELANIRPAVNQIEAHPYLQQRELLQWSKDNVRFPSKYKTFGRNCDPGPDPDVLQQIVITGYSPLGNNIYNIPRAVDDDLVVEVARRLGKTPAQVLISWAVQRGTVVLPKSITPERIRSNFDDFILPEDAFETIQSLEKHQRMNFPARLGVDIFGEVGEASARESALAWAAEQKKLANH
ncbi:ARA1 like protein [Aspergillus parasiticus SU-1]|uniref:D-xylose reductase [NAD(P)H] n=1 Tax=Aspergillus parasiticus (strain ATCC 56775 / NRRL 5862 / SRRC 143 / SU-1) TaxID=1403190 RepID=A0A0F0IIB4_ASPPU|nr:ARA1 like protein [Aspergillus parasiticus SU-1]